MHSINILYDYQAFEMQTHGGVSRCFAELYQRLPKEITAQIGVVEINNIYLQLLGFRKPGSLYNSFIKKGHFWGKDVLFKLYYNFYYHNYSQWDHWPQHNKNYSIKLLEQQAFDIFHPTFFDDYFLKHLGKKPFVITVHDMIPELFPQYYPRDNFQIVKKKILLPKATHIIAVSETTKKDIIRLTDIPEEKITVIYHGASTRPYTESAQSLFDFPYILYVGDRDLYKNFGLFCRDCLPILKKYRELNIVCTGKPFTPQEMEYFQEKGVENRFVHIFVTTNQMMFDLYHKAEVFVYPSAYEGFGIPILEAYKAGCLVMLNKASCFPEIAGNAATYFHMDEKSSDFADMFEQLYNLPDSDKKLLLQQQAERLKLFSWQNSAKQLAKVYEEICS